MKILKKGLTEAGIVTEDLVEQGENDHCSLVTTKFNAECMTQEI